MSVDQCVCVFIRCMDLLFGVFGIIASIAKHNYFQHATIEWEIITFLPNLTTNNVLNLNLLLLMIAAGGNMGMDENDN